MTSHLTEEQIARCRQRILDPAELLALDEHVMACAGCRRRLRENVEWLPRARALRANLSSAAVVETEHPRAEQLTAYLARRLDAVENELVTGHLEFCAQCGERLQAMSQPAVDPTPWGGRWRALLSSLRENLRSFTQPAVFPLRAGAAAALLVLMAATGYWLVNRAAKSPAPVIVKQEPAPAPDSEKPARPESSSPPVKAPPDEEIKPALAQKQPPSPSSALNDGQRQVAIDETGRVTGLESLPPRERELAETALKSGEAPVAPEIAELIGDADATRRSEQHYLLLGDAFPLLSPLGVAVLADQPTFRWRRLKGAESYTVAIFSADYRQVAASQALTGTSWTAPAALERGKVYTWQVKAQKDEREVTAFTPSMTEARFRVLDQAQAAQIKQAQSRYNGSHLTLGALYAQAGLLEEAEAEFRALRRANPKSPVAQKLLSSVRKLRQR